MKASEKLNESNTILFPLPQRHSISVSNYLASFSPKHCIPNIEASSYIIASQKRCIWLAAGEPPSLGIYPGGRLAIGGDC